ncbi:MAG: sigma-70 family RNA polymerase sigma factor [Clostridium sp.]|nr:sigma-70 family RNA polymerase sigma factor [Clostridium sp.]
MSLEKLNEEQTQICEELWNECEPQFRQICNYKLSNNRSEIEEVIADTYLALCRAYASNKKPRKPKAWLMATFSNILKLKYIEISRNTKKILAAEESGLHTLIYTVDFLDEAINDKDIEQLKKETLDELTDSERQLIDLIYEKNMKLKDIAKELGTTEPAIKQKHYRLKKKVKSIAKDKIKYFI